MKKSIVLILILAFCSGAAWLHADKKAEMYLAAITEKNPELKLQKLEAYMAKYGKKKKYQTSTLFVHLVDTAALLKKYDTVEKYAEMALKFKSLSAMDKASIKLNLAYVAIYAKKDITAGAKIADEILQYTETMDSSQVERALTAPALRIKIAALEASAQGQGDIEKALENSIRVYRIDRSKRSADFVFHFSKKLYNDYSAVQAAIKGIKVIADIPNPKMEHVDQLAAWYVQDGIDNEASKYLKISYGLKKSARKAYTIGKLIYIVDLKEGLRYLADAVVLDEAPYSSQARELMMEAVPAPQPAEGEELTEEAIQQAKDEAVSQLIEDARSRLGR